MHLIVGVAPLVQSDPASNGQLFFEVHLKLFNSSSWCSFFTKSVNPVQGNIRHFFAYSVILVFSIILREVRDTRLRLLKLKVTKEVLVTCFKGFPSTTREWIKGDFRHFFLELFLNFFPASEILFRPRAQHLILLIKRAL